MIPLSERDFRPDALTRKVLNLELTFHWIEGRDQFWFRRQTRSGEELVLVDAQTGSQSVVTEVPPVASSRVRADEIVSPDGRYSVTRREHNLWLRDLATHEERPITHDGERHFAYGSGDLNPSFAKQSVARRRGGLPDPVTGVLWSPDSRFIVALRQDLRPFPDRLLVTEFSASDGAYTEPHFHRIPLAGDPATPASQLVIFDTQAATLRAAEMDPQSFNDYALLYFLGGVVWWSTAGSKLFLLTANRGGSRYALNAIDLESGQSREVLHERARFNVRLNAFDYARPNVCVTANGAELIWYSERSGYGHLYLYSARTGELERAITQGDWVVFDLLRVDEARRLIYFTGSTRGARENPYYRYLYRVSLDGGEPELLTPEIADHAFHTFFGLFRGRGGGEGEQQAGSSLSPSLRFFVDSHSTIDRPPRYVLRRISGELIATLLASDATDLHDSGWSPPERVVAKAADGLTDLYGVLCRPRDFDPARRYPVIDVMYPGPQGSAAPQTFADAIGGRTIHQLQLFADAGFMVVALDGRGTAYRSRDFRDAFLGTEDVFGAADHVAAIRHLAQDRRWMDLERVGVRGQSFGGYGALRALLLHPDFFKVAVAATGPDSWLQFPSGISTERFFGVPAQSAAAREHYEALSNARLVPGLSGRVLLIYGGIDENVPLNHAFAMFDAFIRADKDVDMLLIPESPHAVPKHPYAARRTLQYFLDHLAS